MILPLRGNNPDASICHFPQDDLRFTVAHLFAETAIEFLLVHEIGHILGGHLELISNAGFEPFLSEFDHDETSRDLMVQPYLLECDADAFACHSPAHVRSNAKMAQVICKVAGVEETEAGQIEFSYLTYLAAIGALFRTLYPSDPATIDVRPTTHPHPAVRGCFVSSIVIAHVASSGILEESVALKTLRTSVRSVEDIWTSQVLSARLPEPAEQWAINVEVEANGILGEYAAAAVVFNKYSRLPRRWDVLS